MGSTPCWNQHRSNPWARGRQSQRWRQHLYLSSPSRGHSTPLTVTLRLLPTVRFLPWIETWVPPATGPNVGWMEVTLGSCGQEDKAVLAYWMRAKHPSGTSQEGTTGMSPTSLSGAPALRSQAEDITCEAQLTTPKVT